MKSIITLCCLLAVTSLSQAQTITTGSLAKSTYCGNETMEIPFTISSPADPGNIFTAELSFDGTFSPAYPMGTLAGTTSGTMYVTVPAAGGTSMARVRVVASSPAIIGSDNGSNLLLLPAAETTTMSALGSTDNCVGGTIGFTVALPVGSWNWEQSSDGSSFATVGTPDDYYYFPPSLTSDIWVRVVAFNACSQDTSGTIHVNVAANPVAGFTYALSGATATFTNTSAGATSYSWDFGDASFATIANPVHTYSTSGSYDVSLICTNASGCTDTTLQTLSVIVGTDDKVFESVKIAPNPFGQQLNIDLPHLVSGPLKITLLDATGKAFPLYPDAMYSGGGFDQQFDLPTLAPGIYVCQIRSGEAQMSVRLLKL